MDAMSRVSQRRQAHWLGEDAGNFDVFLTELEAAAALNEWPLAAGVEKGIPVYDGERVRRAASQVEDRRDLMAEWATSLLDGAGIIVIKGGIDDTKALDRASAVFEGIINAEKASGLGAGDHFAKPGSNDRIWNALQKHCLADPENFMAYYASDAIAMACEAWLGRGYQITAQVNRVNPGGAAQTPHRDYHLGFMSPAQMAAFPAHIHKISPVLTLQGAVAHCDMPIESGPTRLLPGSQRFFEGYIAYGRPEFQDHFEKNQVQVPLEKGDLLFFNPAVMHGAGANVSSDLERMANLLQISSAFGCAMESMDRKAMVLALLPHITRAKADGTLSETALANVVAAAAKGYAFPTSLDTDPPVGGLAPLSQAAILTDALCKGLPADEIKDLIEAQEVRTRA